MTKDDIIRMAREAGLPMAWISDSGVLNWTDLAAFANLVAAAEREACAKVCDELSDVNYIEKRLIAYHHAYLIRQRGQA